MHAIFDPLVDFALDRFGGPIDGVHPVWWCKAVDAYLERFTKRRMIQFGEADKAGMGLTQDWAAPNTSAAEILQWFDDTISASPRVPLTDDRDMFGVFVIGVHFAEMEDAPLGGTIELPEERLLGRWEGSRLEWWREGRDAIAAIIPETHTGLGVVVNCANKAMLAPTLR